MPSYPKSTGILVGLPRSMTRMLTGGSEGSGHTDFPSATVFPRGPELIIHRVLRFRDNACTDQTRQKYRGYVVFTDRVSCSVFTTCGENSRGT